MLLIMIAGVGATLVVGFSQLLRLFPRLAVLPTGLLLAASHTLVICMWLALSPLYIAAVWGSPYGDVFVPYLLVPGVHVYWQWFAPKVFPWLLGRMESFHASGICVILLPGMVGLLVGGLQWYLLGAAWDRLRKRLKWE
jgi:hypothetical protein